MNRWLVFLLVLLASSQSVQALASNDLVLPARTQLAMALSQPFDSTTAQIGDRVCGHLIHAVRVSDTDVYEDMGLLKDALICGQVSRIEPPIEGRDTIVAVTFGVLEATIPWGLVAVPFQGHLKTPHADHTLGGWLTPGKKPRRIAYLVTMFDGYKRAIWENENRLMGRGIHFEAGDRWVIVLDAPVRLSPFVQDDVNQPPENLQP